MENYTNTYLVQSPTGVHMSFDANLCMHTNARIFTYPLFPVLHFLALLSGIRGAAIAE